MDKLRWGVLGCADIALRAMMPALQRASNGEVVAIASRDLAKAQEAAARHKIPRAYGEYDALLADPAVDAVYIPIPNSPHKPWTVRAIQHGKHVLCEKPLALSTAEVDEIIEAANTHGKVAMEAVMYHLHPQTDRVRQIIRSGDLGQVHLVTAMFTYNLPDPGDIRLVRSLGGGILLDVGTYCVSVARLAMGREPESVLGSARIGPTSDVDEVFTGLLRFPAGEHAAFACSLRGPRQQEYRITGTEGSLTVPIPFAPGTEDRTLILRTGWQRGKEREEHVVVPGADQYQLLAEHFAFCVRSEAQPAIPLTETRANVAAVSKLMESALSGAPVTV